MELSGRHHKICRIIALCVAFAWCAIFLPLQVAAVMEDVFAQILPVTLGTALLNGCLVYYLLSEYPWIKMEEEGIWIRILFRKRFFRWREFQQAGILYRMGRNCYYNELVLVTSKGSKRRYKDRWFLLRNMFTLVRLPFYTEEAREYICRHYGPLDFNLADGQTEESNVLEMDWNETDCDL